MNIKSYNYIAVVITALIIFTASASVCYAIAGAYYWTYCSTGNARCALAGANTCTQAYDRFDSPMSCSSSTCPPQAGALAGSANCSGFVGYGTYWLSGNSESGNSACASIGRTCTTAYNASGSAYSCSSINSGGTALCGAAVTSGASWTGSWSGNGICARDGRPCTAAYDASGSAYSCFSINSGGTALCGDPLTAGKLWTTSSSWSGAAACASIGRTCTTAYNATGATSACTTVNSGGTALCGAAVTSGASWTGSWSGNGICARDGRPCTAAYNATGATSACTTVNSGGTALCSDPATVGKLWTVGTNWSGGAACANVNRTCAAAYNATGLTSTCTTVNSGGTALCGGTVTAGKSWTSTWSGAAACASIGRGCSNAYKSDGTSILCTTTNAGGQALCADPATIGQSWVSTKTWSGGAACAAADRTCLASYYASGAVSSCNTSTAGGTALCRDVSRGIFGYSWASSVSKSGDSACADNGGTCTSAYNFLGASATCTANNLGGVALCQGSVPLITKSYQWNDVKSNLLAYFWNRWAHSGWYYGLGQRDVSITYNVSVKNKDTNNIVNDGSSVVLGDKLIFSFVPHYYADIYWFGTGYSSDSPYGEWRANADPPSEITCSAKDFVGSARACGNTYDVYIPLVAAPPTKTISNTAGMSCGSLTGNENIGYSMECTVSSTGQLNPKFNFNATIAKFYYRYYDTVNWCAVQYTSCWYSCSSTCFPGCYGDNIPLETTVGDIFNGECYGITHSSQPYTLNVPTIIIPYTLTVVIDGACGTANRTYPAGSTTFGSYTICASGTPSPASPIFPTTSSPTTTWVCNGANGGTNSPTCTANLTINGSCGTAAGKIYPAGSTSYGSDTICASGTPIRYPVGGEVIFPTPTVPAVSWNCMGINGGTSIVNGGCQASLTVNGACGSSNGQSFYTKPTTNLCSVGTASSVSGSGPWTWTCNGANGGTNSSCSANLKVNGSCGTANKTYPAGSTSFGSDTICAAGTSNPASPVFPTVSSPTTTWVCNGINGGTNSSTCTAILTQSPPAVQNLQFSQDYCSVQGVFLAWIYSDSTNSPETRFDLQVANDINFTSLQVNRQITGLANPSGTINSQPVMVSANPPVDKLDFGEIYYWRVKVYNSYGLDSGWYPGTSFATTSHPWPNPNFTFTPLNPLTNQEVSFNELSVCCDENNDIYLCCVIGGEVTYAWNFGDGATRNYSDCQTLPLRCNSSNQCVADGGGGIPCSQNSDCPSGQPVLTCNSSSPSQCVADGGGGIPCSQSLDCTSPTACPPGYVMQDGLCQGIPSIYHAYTSPGEKTVTLQVCDDVGCCSAANPVPVRSPTGVPEWREISPL